MLRTYGVSLTLAVAGLASCLLIRGYIGAIPATISQPEPLPATTPSEPVKSMDEKAKAEHFEKLYSELWAGKFKIVSATRSADKNGVRGLIVDGKATGPSRDAELTLLADTIDGYSKDRDVVVFYWEQDVSHASGPSPDYQYRQKVFNIAASRRKVAIDLDSAGSGCVLNVLDFREGRPAINDFWRDHEHSSCFEKLMNAYKASMTAYHEPKASEQPAK
jgi:hypothetical protein